MEINFKNNSEGRDITASPLPFPCEGAAQEWRRMKAGKKDGSHLFVLFGDFLEMRIKLEKFVKFSDLKPISNASGTVNSD